MIDTVRFYSVVSEDTFQQIRKRSIETKKIDHVSSTSINYFISHVPLPSYFRGINIFVDSLVENRIYFELSLPKFIYNHNILLISVPEAIKACNDLHNYLTSVYGDFPDTKTWNINRLDLCYAWYLKDYNTAKELLRICKGFTYPHQKPHYYDTSMYFSSSTTTHKIYLKKDEFKKHDFNDLKKSVSIEYAYDLLRMSKNVLRFEVELRKKALIREYKTDILTIENLFNETKIISIMNKHFNKLMDNQNAGMLSHNDIYRKLIKYCKNETEAVQLLLFYKGYYSTDEADREFIKTCYSRMTVYRKRRQLQKAGIGIPTTNSTDFKDFLFTIPSSNNVNAYLNAADSSVIKKQTMSKSY